MENLMQSDVFFFISSISFILLTLLLVIVFYYIISILKDFKTISEILKNGVKNAGENIEALAQMVSQSSLFKFIFGSNYKKKSKKNKK